MTQTPLRYSYGAHATFPVRYGWLPKGIALLVETGSYSATIEVADALGLGSKMAESLAFWLRATGLTTDGTDARSRTSSEIAQLVAERDRFCELPGTWWFLHLILATTPGTVWSWFFNYYAERLFDRNACADAFLEHTRVHAIRPATAAVAQKDVACLLSAYASRPGVDFVDPEDRGACPLRELGLVWRHEHVNRFERTRSPTGLPGEALLACTSLLAAQSGRDSFSVRELATLPFGPGRIFCVGLDTLETLLMAATAACPHASVGSLAGERMLVLKPRRTLDWMAALYDRIGAGT